MEGKDETDLGIDSLLRSHTVLLWLGVVEK